jgi:hypothetical protein
MPDWIARANIEHFKRLLEAEKDPQRRAVIERELAEEETKLAAIERNSAEEEAKRAALKKQGEKKDR